MDKILIFRAHASPYVTNITFRTYRRDFASRFQSCTFAKVSCASRASTLFSGTVKGKRFFFGKVLIEFREPGNCRFIIAWFESVKVKVK